MTLAIATQNVCVDSTQMPLQMNTKNGMNWKYRSRMDLPLNTSEWAEIIDWLSISVTKYDELSFEIQIWDIFGHFSWLEMISAEQNNRFESTQPPSNSSQIQLLWRQWLEATALNTNLQLSFFSKCIENALNNMWFHFFFFRSVSKSNQQNRARKDWDNTIFEHGNRVASGPRVEHIEAPNDVQHLEFSQVFFFVFLRF